MIGLPSRNRPESPNSLSGAFKTQCRVIGALIMRELHTRYGRENVGYIWMIFEPMLLAGAVAAIHTATPTHYGTDIQVVPFTVVGYGIFIIFRGIFTRAEGTLESNRPLLYHRMVTIPDMLISRSLLDGGSITMTIAILLGFAAMLGLGGLPHRPLWLMLAIFYMVWFSTAAAMCCCAATHDNRLVARLIHPFTYLLMPIAGGFYMLSWIPQPYKTILSYIPLVHIFEMARYGQFEAATFKYVDINYLTSWSLILSILGFLSVKITRRHVQLS